MPRACVRTRAVAYYLLLIHIDCNLIFAGIKIDACDGRQLRGPLSVYSMHPCGLPKPYTLTAASEQVYALVHFESGRTDTGPSANCMSHSVHYTDT